MDTLEDICQNARKEIGTRPMVTMDALFFDYLHNRVPQDISDAAAPGSEPQLLFHDLLKHWTRVATTVRPPQPQVCSTPMQMTKAVVINGSDPGFPGPLCCPLTKANGLSMVKHDAEDYWVTEKSDGIRVVFVSLLAPQFPRWRRIIPATSVAEEEGANKQHNVPQHVRDLCLPDMITVESGFTELRGSSLLQESSQLRLTFGTCILRRTERPDVFALVLRTADAKAAEQSVMLHRMLSPRHFSYVFDRSMSNAYLLLEEYPLTQLASVIMDTELVVATDGSRKRLFLAAFDMYALEATQPGTAVDVWRSQQNNNDNKDKRGANGSSVLDRFVNSAELRRLDRESMSSRLEFMRREVFDSMSKMYQSPLTPFLSLTTVPIVLKQMVKVAQMHTLFPNLTVRTVTHDATPSAANAGSHARPPSTQFVYEYSGYPYGITQNDGFIFTPDQFDIVSGSQPRQLKWKWPGKLTVDWLVKPARLNRAPAAVQQGATAQHVQQQHQAPVGLFDVSLYFKKKREGQTADAGHSQFSRAMVMDNPNAVPVSAGNGRGVASPLDDGGVIVESRFDASRGRWIMEKLRREKSEANSVVTVVSVLESAAENLDLPSLCSLLDVEGPPVGSSLVSATAVKRVPATITVEEHNHLDGAVNSTPTESSAEDDGAPVAPTGPAAASQPAAAVATVKPCKLVVRATQLKFSNEVSLVLQWSVKLPAVRNVITCNHRKIEECFGLGEPCPDLDGSSRLKDLMMIALGNGGGSYAWSNMVADAFFDGTTGRWGIVKLYPGLSSNDAFNTQVLEHLMSVATYHARTGAFPPLPEGLNAPHERACAPLALPGEVAGLPGTTVAWGDVLQVETNRHYAERAVMLSHGKQQRSVLRRMNNFIKSTLLHNGVDSARTTVADGNREHPIRVLDLCCGRGGDLQKWKNLKPISSLVLVDSCFEAVAEAAARYSVGAGLSTKIVAGRPGFPGIPAKFYVRDCFERAGMQNMLEQLAPGGAPRATGATDADRPQGLFDIVSCQFSMHYGFSDETRVRAFLANISEALVSGGVFVGTTVDDRRLLDLRKKHGDRFGNSVYQVDFATTGNHSSSSSSSPLYGDAYSISVEHSVESQTEYVVHWKNFAQLAASEYDLSLVESLNFLDAFKLYVGTSIGQGVLASVVKETGGSGGDASENGGEQPGGSGLRRLINGELTLVLDSEEEEAVGLFRTFVFTKI